MIEFWPDDLEVATEDEHSPVAILKEQASLLGEKTKTIVKAEVVRHRSRFSSDVERLRKEITSDSGGGRGPAAPFRYQFLIHSPALGDYRYRLFEVSFGIESYPVGFHLDEAIVRELQIDPKSGIVADEESEFVDLLSRVLKSQRTRQVIQAILSQAREASHASSRRSE